MNLKVNGRRLRDDLIELSQIGRSVSGGIDRTSFSKSDLLARRWYAERCAAAGLHLRVDGLGNMTAGAMVTGDGPAPVWTGSHIDTVPNGGAFDGAVGSIAALECVRTLSEAGVSLVRPVQAVVFSDEEGNYGHLFGSSGIARGYTSEQLAAMSGRDGDRLIDALANCDFGSMSPTDTRILRGTMHAFIELHIEQGPRLEAANMQIGTVTSIVGLGGGIVEFTGRADHAGATPMDARRDALLGAASFLTRLPGVAASVSPDAVITCGRLSVQPGGANVVPRLVTVTLDFRDPDRGRIDALTKAVIEAAESSARQYDLTAEFRPDTVVDPVPLDDGVQAVISAAADRLGLSKMRIPSAAGHDSQNMALLAPTGMIFVPSKGGRSHCPEEETGWDDIENGANVLLESLVELASS